MPHQLRQVASLQAATIAQLFAGICSTLHCGRHRGVNTRLLVNVTACECAWALGNSKLL
jgi:hypothetical protein